MAASVRVAITSSPTTQGFLAKNGFEKEEKEEEYEEEKMKVLYVDQKDLFL